MIAASICGHHVQYIVFTLLGFVSCSVNLQIVALWCLSFYLLDIIAQDMEFIVILPNLFTGMTMRLWNYVATFSNLPGERLAEIYSKLKQEQEAEAGVGPSHLNGSAPGPSDRESEPNQWYTSINGGSKPRAFQKFSAHSSRTFHRDQGTGKSEAWKRRRRANIDSQLQSQQLLSNGSRLHDSSGILGWGPADRSFSSDRPQRTRQTQFFPGQSHQS